MRLYAAVESLWTKLQYSIQRDRHMGSLVARQTHIECIYNAQNTLHITVHKPVTTGAHHFELYLMPNN